MRFEVDDTVAHPLELVVRTHRDRLAETMALLEEVERVETRSEVRHASGAVEQVHLWRGSARVLPVLLRPVVPPDLLQWRQRTFWDAEGREARWEIEVPGLAGAVESAGTNRYEVHGRGTRISVAGEFHFRPERIEGLAKAVPPGTVPLVERVMASLIVPLVKRSGSAVARFLDQDQGR